MCRFFTVFLVFVAVTQASGSTCDGGGNACYYINDPCPSGTEDCSTQYSCSLESNKCCCKKTLSECPEGWSEFGSSCYYIEKEWMFAVEGPGKCQTLGATLPVIKSAEENQFLLYLTEDLGDPWLGMEAPNGDNDFYWADGTSVEETFSAWSPGEPSHPGIENCAYMYVSGDRKGEWNNHWCDLERRLVVCQKQINESGQLIPCSN